VKDLFVRHGRGQHYVCKTLLGAMGDIVSSLERYGKAWQHAYQEVG
jgi:hypothetical protein